MRLYRCNPKAVNVLAVVSQDGAEYCPGKIYSEETLLGSFNEEELQRDFEYIGDGPPEPAYQTAVDREYLAVYAEALRCWITFADSVGIPWNPLTLGRPGPTTTANLLMPPLDWLQNAAVELGRDKLPDTPQTKIEAIVLLNALIDWAQPSEATPAGNRKKRKPGPRPKEESNNDSLVIAALKRHHKFESGGSVINYDPATNRGLAKLGGFSENALSRFLDHKLQGGHRGYKAACSKETVGMLLSQWSGEAPSYLPDLTNAEYSRGSADD